MTRPGRPGKPPLASRKYLLDRPSQLSSGRLLLCVLAGIGLLYAVAVYVLADTDLLRGRPVAHTRLILLVVHTGYFVIGGAILFVAALLLTHRFVGPAYVMRRAVERMRRGDFTARLSLRRRDYHKELAEELRLLRDELAERDAAQVEALRRLEQCLDEGDGPEARRLLRELLDGSAAERARRAEAVETAA